MAYNPYQINYNPQIAQTPMYPYAMQAVPQAPGVQIQQPQQSNSIIWVQGETGAKSYLVAPNQTVALWDSESQTIFLKSTDSSGLPSMKTLKYTIEESVQQTAAEPARTVPVNYVTKDDFDDFANNIQRQINKLINKNNRKLEED